VTRSNRSAGEVRFHLEDNQRAELRELLGPLVEGQSFGDACSEVEATIAEYKMWREAGLSSPPLAKSKIKAQIRKLEKAAGKLRETIYQLDDETISVLSTSPSFTQPIGDDNAQTTIDMTQGIVDLPRTPAIPLFGKPLDPKMLESVGRSAAYVEGGTNIALEQIDLLVDASKGGHPARKAERGACRRLARIWRSYTGRGLSRQNGGAELDDGPFPAFFKLIIGFAEPGVSFDGRGVAREIAEEFADAERTPPD
jgi:hypothetical protein